MAALIAHKAHVAVLASNKSWNSFFSRPAKTPVSDVPRFKLFSAEQKSLAISSHFATAVFTVPKLCGQCVAGERNRCGSRGKNHHIAQPGAPVFPELAGIQ